MYSEYVLIRFYILYLTQVVLRQIVRMNVSDTRKLDQTKGARQSWSCSMEYSSFVYVYERHLLNNAVYVISVSHALITTARRPPEAEDRFYSFFRVGFRFRFFFETASP